MFSQGGQRSTTYDLRDVIELDGNIKIYRFLRAEHSAYAHKRSTFKYYKPCLCPNLLSPTSTLEQIMVFLLSSRHKIEKPDPRSNPKGKTGID